VSVRSGWRPALRIAWRDVRRSRGRTILVLVMIALPVLAVTAADVVYATSKVSAQDSLDRRIGASDARIRALPGVHHAVQWVDPDSMSTWSGSHDPRRPTFADAAHVLGRRPPAIPLDSGTLRLPVGRGALNVDATETDLTSPLAHGLYRLDSGRWPTTTDEVVVNPALADRGFGLGTTLTLPAGTRTVVGIADSSTLRSVPVMAGLPGSLDVHTGGSRTWLVGGGPVSWHDVRALNAVGFLVLSRDVVDHPPSKSLLPQRMQYAFSSDHTVIVTVLALVVSMALLEVVLLAGPAFAVGARRQSRTLALISASGGTPRQARRVILASGLVLGALASVLGVVLGIGVGWAAVPRVQLLSQTWFGSFDVNWLQLLGIAGFGLLSAFLAAVVPAWIASRQDVVAVLAGRRGDRAPGLRSPVVGVLLLGLGVVGAVAGAKRIGGGDYLIAASAIVSVFGMIFLVPIVTVGLARVCGRLPLTGRYAVRDAARHRTRTVPAIAAVAATVAGVVALGVANTSDAAQNRAQYTPSAAAGTGILSSYQPHPDWAAFTRLVQQNAPGGTVTPIEGFSRGHDPWLRADGRRVVLDSIRSFIPADVLVSDGPIPSTVVGIPSSQVAAAEAMLARGGAVVFTSLPVSAHTVELAVPTAGPGRRRVRMRLPALFVVPVRGDATAAAVVSSRALTRGDFTPVTAALSVTGPISTDEERHVSEALVGQTNNASFYVERGYTADSATRILLLILGVLGGVLMLGGTLTATFLALSDARPDLATLSAVGASPRTRRGVAAAYALVIGFVGAVLGAAVGFIPGIAISYPLTSRYGSTDAGPSHYLAIPWMLILTLVVALPLLTALLVGLAARSKLPLVARLD
jgi:putative ABC transport system permease protein